MVVGKRTGYSWRRIANQIRVPAVAYIKSKVKGKGSFFKAGEKTRYLVGDFPEISVFTIILYILNIL